MAERLIRGFCIAGKQIKTLYDGDHGLQGFGLANSYPREHNWRERQLEVFDFVRNLSKDNLKWKTVRIWFHEAQDAQKADKRVQIVLKKNLG